MGRFLEDLLCGAVGYGLGAAKPREFSQKEVETLIHDYLSQVALGDVINDWVEANDCNTFGARKNIAAILNSKAEELC